MHDLRDFTEDRHRSVDDEPYGGGGGMVMTAPPWLRAVRALSGRGAAPLAGAAVAAGARGSTTPRCASWPARGDLLLLCGRYEGIDERVRQTVVDEEVSIGDYVLSGGELPAMVLIEAVSRQVPGVVQLADSVEQDSFRAGLLDYPHYTRPPVVEGLAVPEVLLSGDHAAIRALARARGAAGDAGEAARPAGSARGAGRLTQEQGGNWSGWREMRGRASRDAGCAAMLK